MKRVVDITMALHARKISNEMCVSSKREFVAGASGRTLVSTAPSRRRTRDPCEWKLKHGGGNAW